jgi:hypothetical protein
MLVDAVTFSVVRGGPEMVGPVRATIAYPGFMELWELSRVFAVDPATIRRRLRAQGLNLYPYPGDKRLRLVAEEDIRAIFRIVPAPHRTRDDSTSDG